MTEYWQGVLTIPAVLVTVAAAVSALFGTWRVLEWWWENRWVKMNEHVVFSAGDWIRSHLGDRGKIMSAIAVVPTAWMLQIWPGYAVVFIGRGHRASRKNQTKVMRAIRKAMDDIEREEQQDAE